MPEALEIIETPLVYGCIFCITGMENAVAQQIEYACDDVRAIVARLVKPRTSQGKKYTEESILFPGYIFFETLKSKDPLQRIPKENILSILTTDGSDWRLYGKDESLVKWLFSYNGVVPFSKAYQEGDRIKIICGPLKDLQADVQKVDKRNRSALVSLTFCNRTVKVWLSYEIVEKKE